MLSFPLSSHVYGPKSSIRENFSALSCFVPEPGCAIFERVKFIELLDFAVRATYRWKIPRKTSAFLSAASDVLVGM